MYKLCVLINYIDYKGNKKKTKLTSFPIFFDIELKVQS